MLEINDVENRRIKIQHDLDSGKTAHQRNKLGQFATPLALALEMMLYAKMLSTKTEIYFLDPAFGTGSFYSAFLRVFHVNRRMGAVGYEIDPNYARAARKLWKGTSLKLFIDDFTVASPPLNSHRKCNLLICNPPYVRHHHLNRKRKHLLRGLVDEASGMKLSGYAGLYCYYIGLAHRWMADNCIAGWLVPSGFLDVNYGHEIRKYLLEKVTLLRIHRFAPAQIQFKEALVSTTIIWFRNKRSARDHDVEFTHGGTLTDPESHEWVSTARLKSSSKWTRFATPLSKLMLVNDLTLSDLFKIKRGLATGANSFFILTEKDIRKHRIPRKFLKPILPNPRFLSA
ncbi:MAG: Eco57I restriction-modification methylase domain-containing protein, partial [Nitrososphaerales archaeon]